MSIAAGLLVALPPVAFPAAVEGQATGPLSSSMSLAVVGGVFKYDPSPGESFPLIALRLTQPVSDRIRFEASTSYTRPEIQRNAQGMFDPTLPSETTNLFTVTFGVQVRWAAGPLEPYGGAAAGFFWRRDDDSAGNRFGRSTFQFPVGLRLWLTEHIGVQGEYRFDFDNHIVVTHSDSEMTAGVFWTF